MNPHVALKQVVIYIDGARTLLTFDSFSGARGYQYLTPGNVSSHAFPWPLDGKKGSAFLLNGHRYAIPLR